MVPSASSICTSVLHLNETIKQIIMRRTCSVVHMMNWRACAKGIRVYSEKALRSTVDDSLHKVIQMHFVSLLDNKATLYDLNHSVVLRDIGVLLITRYWERLI